MRSTNRFLALAIVATFTLSTSVLAQITQKTSSAPGNDWTARPTPSAQTTDLTPFDVSCALAYYATNLGQSTQLRSTKVPRTCVVGLRLNTPAGDSGTLHVVSCVIPAGQNSCNSRVTPPSHWSRLVPTAAFTVPLYSPVEEAAGCIYSFATLPANAAGENNPLVSLSSHATTGRFIGVSVQHRFACNNLGPVS